MTIRTFKLTLTLFFIVVMMFFITMIPTQAYTFNDEDSPATITLDTLINELNGFTLREIFEDNLNVINQPFRSTINENNVLVASTGLNSFWGLQNLDLTSNLNDKLYFFVNVLEVDYFYNINEDFGVYLNSNLTYFSLEYGKIYSNIYFSNNLHNGFRFINRFGEDYEQFDNFTLKILPSFVNLTLLGIDNLSKNQLNYYYTIYTLLNNGIDPTTLYVDYFTEGQIEGYYEGYGDGYGDGYDDGYDDGIEEGDVIGYNRGYNEGIDDSVANGLNLMGIFQLIIGVTMSMLGFIINIELFGISIASILGTLAIGIAIIWTLKLIRG